MEQQQLQQLTYLNEFSLANTEIDILKPQLLRIQKHLHCKIDLVVYDPAQQFTWLKVAATCKEEYENIRVCLNILSHKF